MIHDFFKDMIKYLPANVVPGIVAFISIPIITRLFPPDDYGTYSLAMASAMVLITLSGWLSISVVRFYPAFEKDEKTGVFYGSIVRLTLVSVLLIGVVSFILLLLLKSSLDTKLVFTFFLSIGVFGALAVFNVFQGILMAKRQVFEFSGFAVWKSIMGFAFGLLLIVLFNMGVEGLLLGIIVSVILVVPLQWQKAIGTISVIRERIDTELFKEMARYSFPLVIGNLSAWILSLSDRYVLEIFWGSYDVGVYSAGYNIADRSIMTVVSLFMTASAPILMHIWEKEGEEESKKMNAAITRVFLLTCIPAVIGLSILSKPVLVVMTEQQYMASYAVIPFVASGIFFLGIQQRFQIGFLFIKKTGTVTFAMTASALLNLVANFLFVPKYGFVAAAVTTLMSYILLSLLIIIPSRDCFLWPFPYRTLWASLTASILMGAVVYVVYENLPGPLYLNLFLGVFSGILVYGFLLFLFREFDLSLLIDKISSYYKKLFL